MENVAPPSMQAAGMPADHAPAWHLGGTIPAAKISPLYKLGMAAVAVAMVLLPLLYVALIAGVAYATYRHGVDGLDDFAIGGSIKEILFLYVAPLIIGGLVVIFMIKPLFASRPKHVEPREVTRSDEPALFEFIDRICDLVRAPRPRRVLLDHQVNASASFTRGFLGLLRNDLTLTIGLPLVAGLDVRQLGGVLAHEFGHFAQGAGMRLTFIVRTVNAWFARVVYERDAWDERLAHTAKNIDLRIGIILHFARLMIWLTRKLLWVFMMAGHGISCFMLRQMEFDADHYETQVAGSRGFAETSGRLRRLGVGWQRSIGHQQEAFQSKRLVDDLPGLIALETQRVPAEIGDALEKAARQEKTGWFDTHPSDSDRIRAAARAATEGVLEAEAPATTLFTDFAAAAQRITKAYYREECGIELAGVKLLPLGEMAEEASAQADAQRAMHEFFGELITVRSMVFLSVGDLRAESTADEMEAARARHKPLLEQVPPIAKALVEDDTAEVLASQARALLTAGFKIKKEEFRLTKAKPEAVGFAADAARENVRRHRAELAEAIKATRERLATALSYLGHPYAADSATAAKEVGTLLSILSRLEETQEVIVSLRNQKAGLELLLHNASNAGDGIQWAAAAKPLAADLDRNAQHILARVQGVNYPFAHAAGTVPLADFLGEHAENENEFVQPYLRAEALLDRFFNMYYRILSRLAALASMAEMQAAAEREALAGPA